MAGHSKWANIKHKKARTDAAKGKMFTKAVKEIMIAVKEGGADAESNSRLRLAIDNAKKVNMPNDNIKRAIAKGDKNGDGANFEEVVYEGYASGGVAVLITAATDNKNRTTPEVRAAFNKSSGNMGESGSVAWMFNKCGQIIISDGKTTEDDVFETAIDAGAEDISTEQDGVVEIKSDVQSFMKVKTAIDALGIEMQSASLTYIAENTVPVEDVETASKILKLIDKLEDLDDVQEVYANYDMNEDIFEAALA